MWYFVAIDIWYFVAIDIAGKVLMFVALDSVVDASVFQKNQFPHRAKISNSFSNDADY